MTIKHAKVSGVTDAPDHAEWVKPTDWNANHVGQEITVPYNGKIADITHADTNKHTLDLAAALTETRKIVKILVVSTRITGTGIMYAYPNEGTDLVVFDQWIGVPLEYGVKDGTNRIQYALGTSGDDFDLYCMGYVVEA